MNILFLQTTLNRSCGVTRYIFALADNLPEEINTSVLCFGGNAAANYKKEGYKVTIYRKIPLFFLGNLLFLIYLRKYCKKNKIDLIHNNHRYFDTLTGIFSFLLPGSVTTVHSFTKGRRLLSYKSRKFIAVSNAVKDHLTGYYKIPEEKIKVIHNFIDEKIVKTTVPGSRLRAGLQIPPESKVIFFAGRLENIKGIDLLAEAYLTLRSKNKKVFLLIVGDGKEKKDLEKRLDKADAAILPSVENIFDYYNIADIVVVPSREDPFPYLMLEAGYMGKFIIASDTGGIPELIRGDKEGLLFKKGDSAGLAEKLSWAVDNRDKTEKMAHALSLKIKENYIPGKVIPKYRKLYEKYRTD